MDNKFHLKFRKGKNSDYDFFRNLMIDYIDQTKKKKLRLHVWPNNPSVKLYRRLGYKVIGKTKKGKLLMEKIK